MRCRGKDELMEKGVVMVWNAQIYMEGDRGGVRLDGGVKEGDIWH